MCCEGKQELLVQKILAQPWLQSVLTRFLVSGYENVPVRTIEENDLEPGQYLDVLDEDATFALGQEDRTAVLVRVAEDCFQLRRLFAWEAVSSALAYKRMSCTVCRIWISLFPVDMRENLQVLTIVPGVTGPDGELLEESSGYLKKHFYTKLVRLEEGLPVEKKYEELIQVLRVVLAKGQGSPEERLSVLDRYDLRPDAQGADVLKDYWNTLEKGENRA